MQILKNWQRALWLGSFWLLLACNGAAQTVNTFARHTFEQIKVLILKDGKTRELPVRLRLTGTEIVLEDMAGKALLTATNDEVKAAGYYFTKHRRWQAKAFSGGSISMGLGLIIADVSYPVAVAFISAGVIALPVALVLHHTYSKRHWMTLRTEKETVMLRLDKREYLSVIASLENQTKLTVAWQGER